MLRSMPVSTATSNRLFAAAAGFCAFPGCRADLKATVVQRAHIRSSRPDGPRFDPGFTGDPDAFENLLLLCPNHHDQVDKRERERWSIEKLIEIKRDHEDWIADATRRGQHGVPQFGSIFYANLPRIAAGAALAGVPVELPRLGLPLSKEPRMFWGFPRIIEALHQWNPRSAPGTDPNDAYEGGLYMLEGVFRTKGMGQYAGDPEKWSPDSNPTNDPHIYLGPAKGPRWVVTIDPMFVTGSSSFSVFCGGTARLRALVQVKFKTQRHETIASAFVVGSPPNPFEHLITPSPPGRRGSNG